MEINFVYGDPDNPIEKQANEKGFTLGEMAEHVEILSYCMMTCWVNGLSTNTQFNYMLKKMDKKIKKALKPLEQEG